MGFCSRRVQKVCLSACVLCLLLLVSLDISSLRFFPYTFFWPRTLQAPQPISTTTTTTTTTTKTTTKTTTHPTCPPWKNSTKLLCVRFVGRLGNELFQYTSTLGLALTLHRQPVFLAGKHLPNLLKNYIDIPAANKTWLEERCKNSTTISEEVCCRFHHNLTQLDPAQDFTVGKYLQSYRYFEKHDTKIREAITFSDAIRNESLQVVADLRHTYDSSVLIGVHIRRGDLTSEHNQKLGYPLTVADFVYRSLAFYQALYPRCVFVVGSDDMEWCKNNFPGEYHVHYLSPRSAAVDMLTLSSMDHTVISFGTFSWWVGFLNTGTTVYMEDFIRNGTYIGNTFNPEGVDYIYPGWIPL